MDKDRLLHLESAGTTRRSIVKAGAKLAYAAPIVAATMKLNPAAAQSAGCQPGQDSCNGPEFPCGDCPNSFCTNNTEGGVFCGQFTGLGCETYQKCASSSECPAGQLCAPGPDCCEGICLVPCGGIVSGTKSEGVRTSTAGVPPF